MTEIIIGPAVLFGAIALIAAVLVIFVLACALHDLLKTNTMLANRLEQTGYSLSGGMEDVAPTLVEGDSAD